MELILPILLFAISAAITPGPNNIMLMASGLNFGIRKSIPHLLGVAIGFPIMVILITSPNNQNNRHCLFDLPGLACCNIIKAVARKPQSHPLAFLASRFISMG